MLYFYNKSSKITNYNFYSLRFTGTNGNLISIANFYKKTKTLFARLAFWYFSTNWQLLVLVINFIFIYIYH